MKKQLTPLAKCILGILFIFVLLFLIKLSSGISHVTEEKIFIRTSDKLIIDKCGWYYLNPFKNYIKLEKPSNINLFPIIIQTQDGKIYFTKIFIITKYDMDKVIKNKKFSIININENVFKAELLKISLKYKSNEIFKIYHKEFLNDIKELLNKFLKDTEISISYIENSIPFIQLNNLDNFLSNMNEKKFYNFIL